MNMLMWQKKQPSALRYPTQWSALLLIYIIIHCQGLWQAECDGCISHKLHSVKPSVGYCSLTHLYRRDAVILRRLCLGHTRLTHQYLLCWEELPQCPSCNCALTVVHILLNCQQYNDVSQKYFSVTTLRVIRCSQFSWYSFFFERYSFVQLHIGFSFVL